MIYVATVWDNGNRLALVKEGRKWLSYVTVETPIKVRRVKMTQLDNLVVHKHPDLVRDFCTLLLDRSDQHGGTEGAAAIIHQCLGTVFNNPEAVE